MRRTSDAMGRFPFADPTTCYIEVFKTDDGSVSLTQHGVESTGVASRALVHAATRARAGTSVLYAVWPGKRRSDLFEVNLRQMANAFNWVWAEEGTETQV